MLPSGLSTNLKHLQVSQNVNKTQYEYIHSPPCGPKCMCVHVNNVNMTSRMRREKYGRHENSNTSENIALQFTKRTALWSPDLLTDCGPSWVQRGRIKANNIVDRKNHSCPEPS